MTDAPGLGIRRILVAMDGSAHSLAALDAAAELAGHLRSMLTGIFVEDLDLLHLAGLPFASELGEATATLRKLDAQAVERRLRSRARRIRAAFEHAASRAHVTAAFRVVRGRVAEEVLGASPEADLLVLGWRGHSAPSGGAGSVARAATAGATCSVALVRPGGHLRGRPVVGLLDETPAGRRVLGLAARLAMSDAGNLLLVLPHLPPDRLHAIRAAAADALASLGMSATFHALGANTADELLATFQAVEGRLLLVPAEPPLRPGEIRRIVDGAPCPLVVVR